MYQSTVFVVDDDSDVRESLSFLLDSVNLRAETFESADTFLKVFHPDRPGCLVVDVRMPGISGLGLHARLVEQGICIPTLILTAHGDVAMVVEAMKAGAMDFIEKPYRPQLLLEKIQIALEHDRSRRRQQNEYADMSKRLTSLSKREKEVLDLVVAGKTTREIASELAISDRTADFHRRNVLVKMAAKNAVQLTRLVVEFRIRQSQRRAI